VQRSREPAPIPMPREIMKILFAAACLLALVATPRSARAQESAAPARSPMTFVVMIASAEEETQAAALIDSLRTFGGAYAQAPVILVLADPAKADGRSLAARVQQTVVVRLNEQLRRIPFTDKVYACAQVEELVAGRTDWLVWLNPDCLVLAEPRALAADREAWACLRPVHIQNVGASADGPLPEFWSRIYEVAGLDPAKVWTVESLTDHRKVRGYFNSGCMAFAPQRGLLRAWRDAYERLLLDPANLAFYTANQSYSIFCHQAVLSAVVMAKAGRERVNALPPAYGYPLQLQDQPGFTNRITSLADIVIVIGAYPDTLRRIAVAEPFESWLAAHVR